MKKILLFTVVMMSVLTVFSQQDGKQYPLNDPRNPDCPCHKYQKQAEEEYRRMLQSGNADHTLVLNNQQTNSALEKNTGNVSSQNSSGRKLKHRRHRKFGNKHGRERKQRRSWLCVHF